MNSTKLENDMKYLFNCDFFSDDFDPDGREEHLEFSEMTLNKYSWEKMYQWFFDYLTKKCINEKSVLNAVNLYYYYGYANNSIANPYELVGYVIYRVDIEKHWDEIGDFIDSFAIDVLKSSGKIDFSKNPYYRIWEDNNVIKEKEKFQTAEGAL